jgi:putative hemolysin
MTLDFVILAGLLLITSLISASETALIGLGRIRLAKAIEMGGKRGQALEQWKNDPNRLLTTILILSNASNIILTTIAAFMAVHLADLFQWNRGQVGALVATGVTLIVILFGEVTPKVLAIHRAESIALFMIRPLVVIEKVLRPLTRSLVMAANLVLRPFGLQADGSVPMVTEEEIRALIQMGAEEGVIEDQEHQMIHAVIDLGETQVREVMVPRTEMECINAVDHMDRIIDQIIRTGYSRMPVFRENVDNIVGVVYTKDILSILQNRELIVLQDILRQPYFIPETMKVDELLREFQRGHLHMAIVVDEYGGTSGMVTLEDLIEEIVGDIRDEYDILDAEEKNVEKIEEGLWRVRGVTDIAEINELTLLNLPESRDVNTIAGFVTELMGRVPKKGEQVVFQNIELTILAATSRKIDRLQVRQMQPPPEEQAEEKEE